MSASSVICIVEIVVKSATFNGTACLTPSLQQDRPAILHYTGDAATNPQKFWDLQGGGNSHGMEPRP